MKKDHAPTISATVTSGMPGAIIDNIMPEIADYKYHTSGKIPAHIALVMYLDAYAQQLSIDGGKEFVTNMAEYIQKHLTSLTINSTDEPAGYKCTYSIEHPTGSGSREEMQEIKKKIENYFSTPHIGIWIQEIFGKAKQKDLLKWEKALKRKEAQIAKASKPRDGKNHLKVSKAFLDNDQAPIPTYQGDLWAAWGGDMEEAIANKLTETERINLDGRQVPFTDDEDRLLHALLTILQNKSQTSSPDAADYYTGNNEPEITKLNNGRELIHPKFSCTEHEIAKEFYPGVNKHSGKHYENIRKMLHNIAYAPDTYCKIQIKQGTATYSTFDHLINIVYKKDQATPGKTELFIMLHPVFLVDIKNHYTKLPLLEDMHKAYGKARIPQIPMNLMKELSQHKDWQNKAYKKDSTTGLKYYDISERKLFFKIAPHYMPPKRYRLPEILEEMEKGIIFCKKLNLIDKVETRRGVDSGKIYRFFLVPTDRNPDA